MKQMVGVFCLLLATLGQAAAGEIVINPEVSLTYSDPAGFCRLDPAGTAGEKLVYQAIRADFGSDGSLQLTLLLVDCDSLKLLQADKVAAVKTMRAIGWAVEARDGKPSHIDQSRLEHVAAFAKVMHKILDKTAEQKAAEKIKDLLIDDSDPAVFAYAQVNDNGDFDAGSAYGMTLVKGYGIVTLSILLTAEPITLAPQVAEVQALAHDLIQLNDPAGAGSASESPGPDWIKGLMMLSIAFGAAGTLIAQRKARKKKQAEKS